VGSQTLYTGMSNAKPAHVHYPRIFLVSSLPGRTQRVDLAGVTDTGRSDVFQAHILLYHSTLGLRLIKKKKKIGRETNAMHESHAIQQLTKARLSAGL